jgi:DNA-binding NarL/FixJ family response regulator
MATGGQAVRVLCVDDHAVLIEGLAARFALESGIELVGRLSVATRLVEECDRLKPNVVILDIEMPGPDAFEVADRLKHRQSGVRVMVLSAHIRDVFISAAFRAGASAYFSKGDELSDIVRGIYEIARSRSSDFVLGPKVREKCQPLVAGSHGSPAASRSRRDRITGTPQTLMSSLTTRESEILRLIGKGMSRTQIAAELCRSAKTVDAHQSRMMKKLSITARADLVRLAIREGLAEA